jgi:hypothetical protein
MHLPDVPPAKRPERFQGKQDHRLYGVADQAGAAMSKRLGGLSLSRRTKDDLRASLLSWCADLSDILSESSRSGEAGDHLDTDDEGLHGAMLAWLRADWSTRPALEELCWRMQLHPTLVGAALALYDASEPPSESRRESVARVSN